MSFAALVIGLLGLWLARRRRRALERELATRNCRERARRRTVPLVSANLKGVLAEEDEAARSGSRPKLDIEFHWKRGVRDDER
jgi:hypothetical protein